MSWNPPSGSYEIEPGCFEDPDGSVYVANSTWNAWQAERVKAIEAHQASSGQRAKRALQATPTVDDFRAQVCELRRHNETLLDEQDRMAALFLVLLDVATHHPMRVIPLAHGTTKPEAEA